MAEDMSLFFCYLPQVVDVKQKANNNLMTTVLVIVVITGEWLLRTIEVAFLRVTYILLDRVKYDK